MNDEELKIARKELRNGRLSLDKARRAGTLSEEADTKQSAELQELKRKIDLAECSRHVAILLDRANRKRTSQT